MDGLHVTEIEAHFARLGYELRRGKTSDEPWTLVDRTGFVWDDDFQSLPALWAAWVEYACYMLREEGKLILFTDAYREASQARRAELLDALVEYTDGIHSKLLDHMFGPACEITPDTLPLDWEMRLARNLDSWIGGRPFHRCIFETLEEMDPQALHDWTNFSGLVWMRRKPTTTTADAGSN